ncbi:hypothetical protein LguiB_006988 [Lonicera macranthoides]
MEISRTKVQFVFGGWLETRIVRRLQVAGGQEPTPLYLERTSSRIQLFRLAVSSTNLTHNISTSRELKSKRNKYFWQNMTNSTHVTMKHISSNDDASGLTFQKRKVKTKQGNDDTTGKDVDSKIRRFRNTKTEWGFDRILTHQTFNDTSKGYIRDDACIFGAEVFVIKQNVLMKDVNPYTWKVEKFSTIKDDIYLSKTFVVGGHTWYSMH